MFAILLRIAGTIGWGNVLKMLSYTGVILSGMYTINSFATAKADVQRLQAQVSILKKNNRVKDVEVKLAKDALTVLDRSCQAQAQRFLAENDLWKRIEESADPLTDTVNAVTRKPPQ